jgi:hypothetical protein
MARKIIIKGMEMTNIYALQNQRKKLVQRIKTIDTKIKVLEQNEKLKKAEQVEALLKELGISSIDELKNRVN